MEIFRTIDPDLPFVYTTITGNITLAEIRADMAWLATEPQYRPDMPGIVDMRKATVKLSTDEVRQLADEIQRNPKAVTRTRRALLVSSELAFGIYRMFAAFAEGGPTEYRVFRDERAAKDWATKAA